MKKDKPRQSRRQRALDRFKIFSAPPNANAEQLAAHAAYVDRKQTELASLKHALSV